MKISPKVLAVVYFLMGIFFIYIAVLSAVDTIWNAATLVIALFATLNFGVSIRLLSLHVRLKKKKE
ncbi:YdiK family protein [Virgibacillus sp. C22-A2]|uniref:YdiK family protein n=1 Tax=Virgibacillus tibetensis TaxID=3042313 RepID=A0ABU6KL16_9BACI|nr:YdiK family protein [Virgibacillus sp. C22-A2]